MWRGQGFDFGTITGLKTVAGVEVMKARPLDLQGPGRRQARPGGRAAGTLHGHAVREPERPADLRHPGRRERRILYPPLRGGRRVRQTRSATVKEIADLGDHENLVLVRLDPQGRATALDNLPRPGLTRAGAVYRVTREKGHFTREGFSGEVRVHRGHPINRPGVDGAGWRA